MKNHNIKKVKHLHKLGYLKKDSSDKAIEEIEKKVEELRKEVERMKKENDHYLSHLPKGIDLAF
ncbi:MULTISPECIES: hypothetical protein [Kordia]|uniref:hypothetical protein n=1 Tax=Kordia TaxID=221065 RepID=UPI000629D12F|nr:hypothetical protein [Kordia jejudonensis]